MEANVDLIDIIKEYYEKRNLTFPNFDNAMKFVMTEIAEVYELDLDRSGTWVRNNPEKKPKFNKEDLSDELGDAIFMLIVAGIAEGVNPIESMLNKMKRKILDLEMGLNKQKAGLAKFDGTATLIGDNENVSQY